MKLYKGFNKDMTCNGFQYEEGKTYETDSAKLCDYGFHACEDPLDCFGYYAPGKSIFQEIEMDGVTEERRDDSKRVGTKITVGAEMKLADICKLHFGYVKEKTTKKNKAKDCSAVRAGRRSAVEIRDYSAVETGGWNAIKAGNCSAVNAWDCCAVEAGDCSAVKADDRSTVEIGNCSAVEIGAWSAVEAGHGSTVKTGDCSAVEAGNCSVIKVGNCSAVEAGAWSVIRAGVGSKFRGEMWTIFACEIRDACGMVIGMAHTIVDGINIKPNVWYEVKDGEFVRV